MALLLFLAAQATWDLAPLWADEVLCSLLAVAGSVEVTVVDLQADSAAVPELQGTCMCLE